MDYHEVRPTDRRRNGGKKQRYLVNFYLTYKKTPFSLNTLTDVSLPNFIWKDSVRELYKERYFNSLFQKRRVKGPPPAAFIRWSVGWLDVWVVVCQIDWLCWRAPTGIIVVVVDDIDWMQMPLKSNCIQWLFNMEPSKMDSTEITTFPSRSPTEKKKQSCRNATQRVGNTLKRA